MKKILKLFSVLIVTLLFTFSNIIEVNAASATISVTSSTSRIVIGNTFTVTVRISSGTALGSWEWTINYDTNKFRLVSGEKNVADVYQSANTKSKSYTYKFKAIGTGSGYIGVKSAGAIDINESKFSLSTGSKTVKVITQSELEASYSKNNNLKNLSVEGLTLSPTFSASVTEYKAEAGANTEQIKIKATVADSKSDLAGTGTHEVSEGENSFNVTVTAENGSKKTYKVTINVTDPNPINVKINDKDYVVVKRESNLVTPEGFDKTEIEINEQKIPAFFNKINNFTLVGLKDSEGKTGLYLYDKTNNVYSEYNEVSLNESKIYPLEIDKIFDDSYIETKTKIDGVEFDSLKIKDSEYAIIHAKDLLTGKDDYYTYDSIANSIIRFTDEATLPLLEEIKDYKLLIMILGAETILIILILICILIAKVRHNKKNKRLYKEELKRKELEEKSNKVKQIKKENELEEKETKEEVVEKEEVIEEEIVKEKTIEKKKIEPKDENEILKEKLQKKLETQRANNKSRSKRKEETK